jgi:hypothetical protein
MSNTRVVTPAAIAIFLNRYKIDRTRLHAFMGEKLDRGLALLAGYAGDNVYAVRARDDAAAWLAERQEAQPGIEWHLA